MANRLLKCSKCGQIIGTYPKYCQYCGGEPMTTDENPHIVPVPKPKKPKASSTSVKQKRGMSHGLSPNFYGSPFGSFNSTIKAPKSERERTIDLLSVGATVIVVAAAAAFFFTWYTDKYALPDFNEHKQEILVDKRAAKQNSEEAMGEYGHLIYEENGNEVTFGDSVRITIPEGWKIDDSSAENYNLLLYDTQGRTAEFKVLDNGRHDKDEMVTAWHYAFELRKIMAEQYPVSMNNVLLTQIHENDLYAPDGLNAAQFELADASKMPAEHKVFRTFSGGTLLIALEVCEGDLDNIEDTADELAGAIEVIDAK